MPDGVIAIVYADDLAILVTGGDSEELQRKANEGITMINRWLAKKKLALAPQKFEAVIAVGRRGVTRIEVKGGDLTIETTDRLRYLGVTLGRNVGMTNHKVKVCKRAEKVSRSLSRLMLNVGEAGASRRKI